MWTTGASCRWSRSRSSSVRRPGRTWAAVTTTARATATGASAGTATGGTGAVTGREAITTAPGRATAGRATHDRGYGAAAGRRRLDGCPHRPSGRTAGDHRVAARRALGSVRDLGGRRVAG